MYECPYCYRKLTGPATKNGIMYYICINCDKFFDMFFITQLMSSASYIREIAKQVRIVEQVF